jgi:hypothetical protein
MSSREERPPSQEACSRFKKYRAIASRSKLTVLVLVLALGLDVDAQAQVWCTKGEASLLFLSWCPPGYTKTTIDGECPPDTRKQPSSSCSAGMPPVTTRDQMAACR